MLSSIKNFSYEDGPINSIEESHSYFICFNHENMLVNYYGLGGYGRFRLFWNVENYEFTEELKSLAEKSISELLLSERNDNLKAKLNELINKCTGFCKNSTYYEFLQSINKPEEECFDGNLTSEKYSDTFSYCNTSILLSYTSLFGNITEVEPNPEFEQKEEIIDIVSSTSDCIKDSFKKFYLPDSRNCFIFVYDENCKPEFISGVLLSNEIYCFNDKYLTNTYSINYLDCEKNDGKVTWEKDFHTWNKENFPMDKKIENMVIIPSESLCLMK